MVIKKLTQRLNGDKTMDYKKIILNKLLDKYEVSKSLFAESNRRIILKIKDLKEYDIENYENKKIFHDVVNELEAEHVIYYSWKLHEKRKHLTRNMVR